jgi:GT2 family glycosyltransferase
MVRVSIIIPVLNLAAVTRQCLDRLLDEAPVGGRPELIVVDDGSRDETPRLLAAYGERIRVVTHATNQGYATACNDGAAIATGDDLVFLNNDTIPSAGWLDALVQYAESHPQAGAVGSKLVYPDSTIQHAGIAIDQDYQPRHIYVGFPSNHPAVNKSRRMQMVTGGCILITRQAFTAAGGFDTRFTNGFEDVDLCLRLGALGYEIHYCAESELVHLESVSERPVDHDVANRSLFLERWKHDLQIDDWRYYLEDELIRITYPGTAYCPLQFTIAPLLGVVDDGERQPEADRLLDLRARQVRDLLKENIALLLRRNADSMSA